MKRNNRLISAVPASHMAWFSVSAKEILPIYYIDTNGNLINVHPTWIEQYFPERLVNFFEKLFNLQHGGSYVELPDWLNRNSSYVVAYSSSYFILKYDNEATARQATVKEFVDLMLNMLKKQNDEEAQVWYAPVKENPRIQSNGGLAYKV